MNIIEQEGGRWCRSRGQQTHYKSVKRDSDTYLEELVIEHHFIISLKKYVIFI